MAVIHRQCFMVKLKTRLKCMVRRPQKLTNGGEGDNTGVRENWRDGAKRDAARVSLQRTADGGD